MDSVAQENGYTTAWTASEILEGDDTATREADVFAFGMVVIEVRYPWSWRWGWVNGSSDV